MAKKKEKEKQTKKIQTNGKNTKSSNKKSKLVDKNVVSDKKDNLDIGSKNKSVSIKDLNKESLDNIKKNNNKTKKTKSKKNINKDNDIIKVDSSEEKDVEITQKCSRVLKNKKIYLETEDYLRDNDLDTTFVDKKFNIDNEFMEKTKKHIFLRIIFYIFVILLFCFSCFSIYVFINYEEKVKIVKEKEIVVDENIVFLGDSITDFYDLDKYFSNRKVVNSGVDGNKTSDILNNMKKRIYDYNPSKVFILIGTNDISQGKSVDEIVDNIKKIVEQIKENRPYTEIYLESIYPINDTDNEKIDHNMVNGRKNDTIKEINSKIIDYSTKNNVIYIDVYKELCDDEGNLKLDYTKEGLHLSDKGYEVVTKKLNDYLNE